MIRKKVEEFIQQYNMLQRGDTVIVGVSGGADSICLLWILKELQYQLKIVAVHVHHGIRGIEADEDEAYVQNLCKQWNVSFHSVHANVPLIAKELSMTVEEAGRKVRYDAFSKVAEQYTNHVKIAVAHHMDDNTETILMNLFRGSGLRGISGIEPVRDNIIRPLLCVRRSEIEQTLIEQKIAWRTDATNLEPDYTRNKIRLQIIPAILEAFPQAEEHILQTAQIVSETDEFLNKLAYQFIDKYATLEYNEIVWDKEAFIKEDIVLQKIIVRQALVKSGVGLKDITSKHIQDICSLANKSVGKTIQLPYGWQGKTGYKTICITSLRKHSETYHGNVPNPNFQMDISIFPYPYVEQRQQMEEMGKNKKNVKFPENQYTKWFDYDTIKDEVVLRTRNTGDRIQVNPMGSKKLKDYMIDAKIPKELRDTIPVVASGNQILWVVGYRISEAFKVTAQTKTIMQITLLCEKKI